MVLKEILLWIIAIVLILIATMKVSVDLLLAMVLWLMGIIEIILATTEEEKTLRSKIERKVI